MHPAERRREQRRKIAEALLENASRTGWPTRRDFLELQKRLLETATPGTPVALAIGEITWNEVRDDIDSLYRDRPGEVVLLKNLVSIRHAANIAKVDLNRFIEAMQSRGYSGSMLERKEIRAVLSTLYARSRDDEQKDAIKAAIYTFADEPERSSD